MYNVAVFEFNNYDNGAHCASLSFCGRDTNSSFNNRPRCALHCDDYNYAKDIKQIYRALFRATSEIMDSSVTEKALCSSGLRPSEHSAFPVTSESIISTRGSQCMVYLFTILNKIVLYRDRVTQIKDIKEHHRS